MTSLGFFGFDHAQLFCFCFFLFLPLYFCTHSVVLVLCVSLFSTLPLDTLIIFRILSTYLPRPRFPMFVLHPSLCPLPLHTLLTHTSLSSPSLSTSPCPRAHCSIFVARFPLPLVSLALRRRHRNLVVLLHKNPHAFEAIVHRDWAML
jgi:hypothetical protein